MKYLLGSLFVLAGVNHFARAASYVAIVPRYLPFPIALVYASGFGEIALGLMLLVPRLTRLAAWGLIALLVAVFPANIEMALHPELHPTIPLWLLWLRLPLQGLLIWWAYLYTRAALPTQTEGAANQ